MLPSPFKQMQDTMNQILEVRYSDLELERKLCTTLLETAERERYAYGVAFAHTYLGDYYIAQNDSARCSEALQQAMNICSQNAFYDLLLRVHNLYGICYESLSDEQSALRQYVNVLDLLEVYPDPVIECTVLNNIASNFEMRRDYVEALEYYTRAEQALMKCQHVSNYTYLQLRFQSNLSESLLSLGRLEEGRHYIELFSALETDETDVKECACSRGWCHYWALKGDMEKASEYARRLLAGKPELIQDKYFAFEMLLNICSTLIGIGEKTFAGEILDRLQSMRNGDEVDRMQQIHKLKVEHREAFGTTEEKNQAYMEYYSATARAVSQMDQVRADGMKAVLRLRSVLQEKDAAEQDMRKMEQDAHLDELTGLYNRRYFNKLSSKVAARTDLKQAAIIMLDVDYFKEYNDTYGHLAGDQVLKQVAELIHGHADGDSTPARYGGDEFICLCLDKTDEELEASIALLRDELAALNIEHSTSHCAQRVTLSIGYFNTPFQQYLSIDSMIDKADQALYRAKSAGRDCWTK